VTLPCVSESLLSTSAFNSARMIDGCTPKRVVSDRFDRCRIVSLEIFATRLQLDHRERRQWMPLRPMRGEFDKAPMEARTGPAGEQRFDEGAREVESSEAARNVDPIGAPKGFDDRAKRRLGARDLVMIDNHRLDFGNPVLPRVGRKVLARELKTRYT